MVRWKIITVLFKIFLGISASTHWVVTEDGKIQSQLDSAFHMRRPYDLISLLEQEHRAAEIDRLYGEMVERKARIDAEWAGLESASELESRLYSTDPDCLQAGRPLSDLDLYISVASDGIGREGIDLEELLPESLSPADVPDTPDCGSALELPFSMRTFPHLQVLSWNLTTAPEFLLGLKAMSDVAGRQIAAGLKTNHTSWYLHNLAALYWRGQGDAWRALQCAKRAVYLSPRQYKDISLLNLGCLVHQARCPAEAAILLHAAVDHAPHVASSHLALANVYAILGDYNRSIACYNNALKLQPHWTTAERNRFAVLCHYKLENSLYQLHRSLQDILSQLHEYHSLQEQWLKHQEQLMYQQAPLEVKLQGFQDQPLGTLLSHRGDKCLPQVQRDGSTVLSCDSKLLAHHLQIDITLSLQMLLKNVEAQAQKISEQMSRRLVGSGAVEPRVKEDETHTKEEQDSETEEDDGALEIFVETVEEDQAQSEQSLSQTKDSKRDQEVNDSKTEQEDSNSVLLFKHPKLQSLNYVGIKLKDSVVGFIEDLTKSGKIDREMLFPEQHCSASNFNKDSCGQNTNHWLNPSSEDDGKQLRVMPIAQTLGIVQEGSWLKNTSTHVIATLVITCIQLSQWESSEVPPTEEEPACASVPNTLPDLTPDSFRHCAPEPRLLQVLRSLLLDDNVRLTDLASHLTFAMKDSSRHEPSSAWLLETTAALYWRGVGDHRHMVDCLQAAVHKAPPDLKDIPLHHVAHILLTLGHRHEALLLATLALKVSPRSINAHMVLFHTYLALGENENAMKYGKATLTLYEQSQSNPEP